MGVTSVTAKGLCVGQRQMAKVDEREIESLERERGNTQARGSSPQRRIEGGFGSGGVV